MRIPRIQNKIFRIFVPISYFVVFAALIANYSFLVSNTVSAANIPTPEQAASDLARGTPIESPQDIFNILQNIVVWTYRVFFIVAIFFILLAAYNFLFARGDPEKIKSARSQILWAVVAIVVALLSVAAAQIILSFIKNP